MNTKQLKKLLWQKRMKMWWLIIQALFFMSPRWILASPLLLISLLLIVIDVLNTHLQKLDKVIANFLQEHLAVISENSKMMMCIYRARGVDHKIEKIKRRINANTHLG